MITHRVDVAIVGAGPAGLLLSQMLDMSGITSVVVEKLGRSDVLTRNHPAMIEAASVQALRDAGIGERLSRDGYPQTGFEFAFSGRRHRIDLQRLAGKRMTLYSQADLTQDLVDARQKRAGTVFWEARNVQFDALETETPAVGFEMRDRAYRIDARFIVGCDGADSAARAAIPDDRLTLHTRDYPFAWMSVLAEVPPACEEFVYASHDDGLALCAMRSPTRARYYMQVNPNENLDAWPDRRVWDELVKRFGGHADRDLVRGPITDKSVTGFRSMVAEPMRYGSLFLAGDAAHTLPHTGAKGLNLAISDVWILHRALAAYFTSGSNALIDAYSETCLRRIWKAERFSWWMTWFTHAYPDFSSFDRNMQRAEFEYVIGSEAAATAIAENYAGLPIL
ncbi:4-hydroxybenzoate 3-monooxygenase [Cucumibacter marinus]|uniref:4-hydroxybenzoate 3-monooxygenase n=1 Tax=Cucumibacter marinus TaxID=1121252 RepID=UPI0004064567|nr:4-hydroxybenzoate 3-monooxygenase [Cucumibacter marinus]